MFKPDEWAVLRHNSGGRLFQVGEVRESPSGSGNFLVMEKRFPHSMDFEVWHGALVKVAGIEEGQQLVAVLTFIHMEHERAVKALEAKRDKLFSQTTDRYMVFEDEQP